MAGVFHDKLTRLCLQDLARGLVISGRSCHSRHGIPPAATGTVRHSRARRARILSAALFEMAAISDGVVKIILMDQQQFVALLAQSYRHLDFPSITRVRPARIAVGADHHVVDLGRDIRRNSPAEALHQIVECGARVFIRSAGETKALVGEGEIRADRAEPDDRSVLGNERIHHRLVIGEDDKLREKALQQQMLIGIDLAVRKNGGDDAADFFVRPACFQVRMLRQPVR